MIINTATGVETKGVDGDYFLPTNEPIRLDSKPTGFIRTGPEKNMLHYHWENGTSPAIQLAGGLIAVARIRQT